MVAVSIWLIDSLYEVSDKDGHWCWQHYAGGAEGPEVPCATKPPLAGSRVRGHSRVCPSSSRHIRHFARVLRSGDQSPVLRRSCALHTGRSG